VGVQDFADAEVEKFDRAVGPDQNISRFEIAMDDELAMSMGHRRADIQEKFKNLAGNQVLLAAVFRDGLPGHELHDDVRQPFGRGAAVEQAGDVRMIELGENLPLAPKTPQDKVRVQPGRDQLDSGGDFVLVVVALGKIDRAHAAVADLANEPVRAGALRGAPNAFIIDKSFDSSFEPLLDKGAGILVVTQQRVDLAKQFFVFIAGGYNPAAAIGGGNFHRLVKDLADSTPGFRSHLSEIFDNSRCSQASATR
jgi:hypothetical protein